MNVTWVGGAAVYWNQASHVWASSACRPSNYFHWLRSCPKQKSISFPCLTKFSTNGCSTDILLTLWTGICNGHSGWICKFGEPAFGYAHGPNKEDARSKPMIFLGKVDSFSRFDGENIISWKSHVSFCERFLGSQDWLGKQDCAYQGEPWPNWFEFQFPQEAMNIHL